MPKKVLKFKEHKGDLWEFYGQKDTQVFVTTNGSLKPNNELVMGRGCAREAKDRIPDIAIQAGNAVSKYGNQVIYFDASKVGIFPTKNQWYHKSDKVLIERSCQQLKNMADANNWTTIVLPRPGCGNGGLDWEHEVQPILVKYLDDRFTVVSK